MRIPRSTCLSCLTVLAVFSLPNPSQGVETATAIAESDQPRRQWEYFSVDVQPAVANFGQQHVVSEAPLDNNTWYQMNAIPRVAVDPGSEAFLLFPSTPNDAFRDYKIVGIKPKGEPLTVRLFALRRSLESTQDSVLAKFEIPVRAEGDDGTRKEFLRAKGEHFARLWNEQLAGSAMFRHLAEKSLRQIGESPDATGPRWPLRRNDGVDDTIRLVSGGRAVSENLQLDRQIGEGEGGGQLKSLHNVRGITVREIDWTSRLRDEPTELDPLAKKIPHDQHAMFLPSFDALANMIDQGNELLRPAVQWFEPQSRKTDVLSFYQGQLGLPLNALTRQVGGALIGEVAITGSDPYFRTGTDIAILMKSNQPKFLQQALVTQIAAQAASRKGVTQNSHNFTGHAISEWSDPGRDFCSFVAVTDGAVVVTNSLTQMMNVLNCADGKSESLAGLDEYRFFRQRYLRGVDDESALVVISDATIRRWCSPSWRIAASRRTRARATIAEMTMDHANAIVRGTVDSSRRISARDSMPDAGELWLDKRGVRSQQFGTLRFQTPIAEMNLTKATAGEIKLYESWRNQYERQWRRSFDPIALKVSVGEDSMTADLSVIPLMMRTQYRWWIDWVGTARLKPNAGDHHPESLASFDLAVNMQSTGMTLARGFLMQQGQNIDLLNWIDGSVSCYLDMDEAWFRRAMEAPPSLQSEDLARDIPIGVFIPSRNNFRMTAFLVAARGLIEQFAPNMIRWEQVEYNDLTYVRGTVVENTAVGNSENLPNLYYVTTPEGLSMSLNHIVIERVIDRHLARKKDAKKAGGQVPVDADEPEKDVDPHKHQPQIVAKITGKGAAKMALTDRSSGLRRMSRIAWSNVPILNYLRHRYPDRDPAEVYRRLLGEELTEPSDGQYRWVEKHLSYESSHYGHPLAPRIGPAFTSSLGLKDAAQASLSFDDGGLRAQMTLTRGK